MTWRHDVFNKMDFRYSLLLKLAEISENLRWLPKKKKMAIKTMYKKHQRVPLSIHFQFVYNPSNTILVRRVEEAILHCLGWGGYTVWVEEAILLGLRRLYCVIYKSKVNPRDFDLDWGLTTSWGWAVPSSGQVQLSCVKLDWPIERLFIVWFEMG